MSLEAARDSYSGTTRKRLTMVTIQDNSPQPYTRKDPLSRLWPRALDELTSSVDVQKSNRTFGHCVSFWGTHQSPYFVRQRIQPLEWWQINRIRIAEEDAVFAEWLDSRLDE